MGSIKPSDPLPQSAADAASGGDFRDLKGVKTKYIRICCLEETAEWEHIHDIGRTSRPCLTQRPDEGPDPENCPSCRKNIIQKTRYFWNVLVYETDVEGNPPDGKALAENNVVFYRWRLRDALWGSLWRIFHQAKTDGITDHRFLDIKIRCKPAKEEKYQDLEILPCFGEPLWKRDDNLKKRVGTLLQASSRDGGRYNIPEMLAKGKGTKEEMENLLSQLSAQQGTGGQSSASLPAGGQEKSAAENKTTAADLPPGLA